MKSMKIIRQALLLILAAGALCVPVNLKAKAMPLARVVAAAQEPNIGVKGYFSLDKAQPGRTLQAAVVMEIPKGYHINANTTTVKIENVGDGVKVGSVSYPRALIRKFSFSEDELAVYEGRAVMRFTLTIPAGFPHSKMLVKARVKYQSCSNEVCYAPATRDLELWIGIAADKETPKSANGNIFGGKKG